MSTALRETRFKRKSFLGYKMSVKIIKKRILGISFLRDANGTLSIRFENPVKIDRSDFGN
jgi:hypothetical protein